MEYNFFKDELGTIWYRDCIKVEADSYEEAVRKITDIVKNGDDYETIYSEPIWETWEERTVEEESGCATIEIEDPETRTIIWKNGK